MGRADHLDPIKMIVWSFLDQPTAWQFLDEGGWKDCLCSTQQMLNNAEREGVEGIPLLLDNGHRYHYDLRHMFQTNCRTGKTRPLRRGNSWSKAEALPRWQYETRSGWSDCDVHTQELLGAALLEAETTQQAVVHRMIRGSTYALDFESLTQTNLESRRLRALRFAV